MKNLNRITLIVVIVLTVLSCDDILEKDISKDVVELITPLNHEEIESNVVTFKWNSLPGTNKYRIQVFGNGQAKILDTLVNKTDLTYPLIQGKYQWKVRAENFAYESSYSLPADFSIIESDDLKKQKVVLMSPADNIYTNKTSQICNWKSINAADYYYFELIDLTNGETVVYKDPNMTNTTLTLNSTTLNAEAKYMWKIKAVNSTSETLFSTSIFSIDRTKPNQPQNNLPAQDAIYIINKTINFNWTSPADTGTIQSPITYTIEFSNDIAFTTAIQKFDIQVASFDKAFTLSGTYYWRVKALDLAENVSTYSTPFKFIVN